MSDGANRAIKAIRGLALFCLALVVLMVVGWVMLSSLDQVNELSAFMKTDAVHYMLLWRVTTYSVLILYWTEICEWAGGRYNFSPDEIDWFKNKRTTVALTAVSVEIVINQNLAGVVMAWLSSN